MKNGTDNETRRLVDLDTGEYIEVEQDQRLVVLDKGDRQIKGKSIKNYKKIKEISQYIKMKEDDKYLSWDFKHYAKTNTDELKLLMPELSKIEKVLLLSILPYVGYDDCCLKYNNGRDLNVEGIAKVSGLSISATEDAISSLKSKDILYKGKNSRNVQYFVNPWICSRGSKVNKTLKTMFKNYKIRILNKKWKDL